MNIITLNGKEVSFKNNETLYDCVSRHLGQDEIPVLCHDPVLEPIGACRMCLVDVAQQQGGASRLLASCHTPAAEG